MLLSTIRGKLVKDDLGGYVVEQGEAEFVSLWEWLKQFNGEFVEIRVERVRE